MSERSLPHKAHLIRRFNTRLKAVHSDINIRKQLVNQINSSQSMANHLADNRRSIIMPSQCSLSPQATDDTGSYVGMLV